jgi:hypothetical protein
MNGQHRYRGVSKAIGGVAIVGFFVTSALCEVGGVASSCCFLPERTALVTFEVVRAVMLLVAWQATSAYLYQDSGFLHHLLQIETNLWPLLFTVTGQQ